MYYTKCTFPDATIVGSVCIVMCNGALAHPRTVTKVSGSVIHYVDPHGIEASARHTDVFLAKS